MEPVGPQLTFIVFTKVAEISPEAWFSLEGFGARLHTKYDMRDLSVGDRVKITIQKVPECPLSPTIQPAASSNS